LLVGTRALSQLSWMENADMNKTLAALAAVAWASVAIANASPANALAFTIQTGEFANCSSSWSSNTNGNYDCTYSAPYEQTIKFVETSCNAGGCNSESDWVLTDMIYGSGRKNATYMTTCSWAWIYGLGPCAC
jgi:hypothetical protein